MSRGTNLEYARGYNRRIVLETIRRHGPLSRVEIAQRTSLAIQTIANIIQELLDRGLVITGERRQGKRGSPSVDILINPDGAYSIGVNFDRDQVTGALLDLSGTVHAEAQFDLSDHTPEEVLPLLSRIVDQFLPKVELGRLLGVAIGVPGPLHLDKRDGLMPEDLLDWSETSVKADIEERFGLKTFVERNANAAAIGEYWYGVGRSYSSFFYVYVGIGLGSAIIEQGSLLRDQSRLAGKIGYVPIVSGRSDDAATPLKSAFSFASLKKALGRRRTAYDASSLELLFRDRDPALLSWLDSAATAIAPILYSIECLLEPPAIVFGGRLPTPLIKHALDRADDILMGMRTAQQLPIHPQLLFAQASANVAALGVATVPLYELLGPDHSLLLKGDGSVRRSQETLPL